MIGGLDEPSPLLSSVTPNRRDDPRFVAFNIANLMALQQRERVLGSMLAKDGLSDLSGREILDVGCGAGTGFFRLMAWGASPRSLHGIDIQRELVQAARGVHPELEVVEGNAAELPWSDDRFDMITQFTAFTSIADATTRKRAAMEMDRVSRPGGYILWYDFWVNPRNRATHPIGVGEIRALFPNYRTRIRRTTLAPPLARVIAPRAPMIALMLQELWFLQTHLLAVMIKPGMAR
jgi:ubiquinone/menaquinone biosynthesis C-methylase UbiE